MTMQWDATVNIGNALTGLAILGACVRWIWRETQRVRESYRLLLERVEILWKEYQHERKLDD
jgi:hypothetical protein